MDTPAKNEPLFSDAQVTIARRWIREGKENLNLRCLRTGRFYPATEVVKKWQSSE